MTRWQRSFVLYLAFIFYLPLQPSCWSVVAAFQLSPTTSALQHQQPTTTSSLTTTRGGADRPKSRKQQQQQQGTAFSTTTFRQQQRRQPSKAVSAIFLASAGDENLADRNDKDNNIPMAISWIGATTSAFVAGTFYLVLAWQRDALMVAFFLGSIINGFLSKILKRLINQSRPPDLVLADESVLAVKPSDGGMPSSHAMSLGFIGTFTALHIVASSWKPIMVPLLVAYVMISLWYRVRVKLHTTAQVVVGATVGSANALLFDQFVKDGLMTWFRLHVLDAETGLLPLPLLVVPAIVGVILVGSLERRIALWLEQRKAEKTS